jgi:CheY-like chemotaxis protein
MPDVDGFAVAERVARRPELAGSTILMLSSSGLERDVRRCREIGIAVSLTKPINANDLLDAICLALDATPAKTAAAPMPKVAAPLPAPTRVCKVLVAEDNVVNQRVASGLLTRRGHTAVVVGNGQEAIDALARDTFDVVLMDVQMPMMGGFEATAAIRAREKQTGGHIRIVAMTAHVMNGDRERCIGAGMDGYLSKPLDARMMFSVVEGDDPGVPATAAAGPGFDRSVILERLGGDEALLADVIGLFLEDCPSRLNAIKAAVMARHADAIRIEAHGLKGAAGNLAATRLFNAAEVLERIGAEARLDAAEAAWRLLSMEANLVLDALRQFETRSTSTSL